MNTLRELINSNDEKKDEKKTEVKVEEKKENKETKIKESAIEKKAILNRERKVRRLDPEYQEMSNLGDKTGARVLSLLSPFIGTILSVIAILFSAGIRQELLVIILPILICTGLGNLVSGLFSLKLMNDELARTEIDMYKNMQSKNKMDTYMKEQAELREKEATEKLNKVLEETKQLREDNEKRKIQEEVARRVAEKEKEINEQVEKKVNAEIAKRLKQTAKKKKNEKDLGLDKEVLDKSI